MSSERARVHTSGTLNRGPAEDVLNRLWRNEITHAAALDALEACVVPDPRLARIEALEAKLARIEKSCDIADGGALVAPGVLSTEVIRAILRGDQ